MIAPNAHKSKSKLSSPDQQGSTSRVKLHPATQAQSPTAAHNQESVKLASQCLTIQDVINVARTYQPVAPLELEVKTKIECSANWVADLVKTLEIEGSKTRPYYGINTGFGAQAGKSTLKSAYLTKVLSRNLVASHSAGVGDYFHEEIVRAAMLIRAQSLAHEYSGVRPLLVEKLIEMLNRRVYPAIPSQGSLGASGDLAPLSHLALAISQVPKPGPKDTDLHLDPTDGEVFVPCNTIEGGYYHISENYLTQEQTVWQKVSGAEGLASLGGQIELQAKEGLALSNGTSFSAAIAALAVGDAQNLLANAELALAMTLEGIRGFRDSFFPEIHEVRGHSGAKAVAAQVLRYTSGSQLLAVGTHDTDPERIPPQDPYSVRCGPQVLGTIRETLDFVTRLIETEINAVTDNPLLFLDLKRNYKTVSGGNFHGEPIAMTMDFLGIGMTELGSISERRIFQMTDYYTSVTEKQGLSSFLVAEDEVTAGLNSGLMIAQYTAAALVSDCKVLAHPDSVDSINSSANREDHVSMSLNAARHARAIIDNVEKIVAIELICAAQAIDLQLNKRGNQGLKLGFGTYAAYQALRQAGIDQLKQDRVLYPDIRTAIRLVRNAQLVQAAQQATGETQH